MQKKNKYEIGSFFPLQRHSNQVFCANIIPQTAIFVDSGRSSIKLVLNSISPKSKTALLPAYICESVIIPFLEKGYTVYFYDITKQLNTDFIHFSLCLQRNKFDVILINSYFGFKLDAEFENILCNANGAIIIEDITQNLFTDFLKRTYVDYFICSLRKFFPIPDGGFAFSNKHDLSNEINPNPAPFSNLMHQAMNLKGKYAISHNKQDNELAREMYQKANFVLDKQLDIHTISNFSLSEMQKFDINLYIKQYQQNYAYIFSNLTETSTMQPVINLLSDEIIPLYFPIYSNVRSKLQAYMISNGIFAPIIWPRSKHMTHINSLSDYIYSHILCLPIDYRYNLTHMKYIIKIINEFIHSG